MNFHTFRHRQGVAQFGHAGGMRTRAVPADSLHPGEQRTGTPHSALAETLALAGLALVLDLVAAMRWVKRNIAGFGGDPNNVTILGESGGGSKVISQMASPNLRAFLSHSP